MSSLLNKAKAKLEQTLDKNNNHPDNPHSSNAGPHSSNLMNKADPYVDSDRDHRNDPTSRVGGVGSTQEYSNIHGQSTATGGVGGVESGYGHGHTAGHTGGLASGHTTGHNVGHTEHTGGLPGQGLGHTGHAGHTGPAVGHHETTTGVGAPNTYDNPQSANTGPHRSNLANKLDPRVDSDRDNRNDPTSRVGGYGTQSENYGHNTGVSGTHGTHGLQHDTHGQQHTGIPGTHGGHGVQHDTYGQHTGVSGTHGAVGGNTGYGPGAATGAQGGQGYGATPGSGSAANTAGPHNSDLLNKLDPRVDADLDGSKTYGGNATYR